MPSFNRRDALKMSAGFAATAAARRRGDQVRRRKLPPPADGPSPGGIRKMSLREPYSGACVNLFRTCPPPQKASKLVGRNPNRRWLAAYAITGCRG
jgi:hypothetical protein